MPAFAWLVLAAALAASRTATPVWWRGWVDASAVGAVALGLIAASALIGLWVILPLDDGVTTGRKRSRGAGREVSHPPA